jgi:hypothetical protein
MNSQIIIKIDKEASLMYCNYCKVIYDKITIEYDQNLSYFIIEKNWAGLDSNQRNIT